MCYFLCPLAKPSRPHKTDKTVSRPTHTTASPSQQTAALRATRAAWRGGCCGATKSFVAVLPEFRHRSVAPIVSRTSPLCGPGRIEIRNLKVRIFVFQFSRGESPAAHRNLKYENSNFRISKMCPGRIETGEHENSNFQFFAIRSTSVMPFQ